MVATSGANWVRLDKFELELTGSECTADVTLRGKTFTVSTVDETSIVGMKMSSSGSCIGLKEQCSSYLEARAVG